MVEIAILGFGVVGGGAAEVLTENKKLIASHCGDEIHIKYILDLREFPDHPLGDRVIHDFDIILQDPEVKIVLEMMGGSHPAYDYSKAALLSGKSVVTSNKEVVSTFGVELLQLAKEKGVSYLFEASVGGGIPIIRPMQTDLSSNKILAVSGILNGTTNYILTKMKDEGAEFSDALKEAQRLGYAEANPAADVEGIDAARKITILAALAFGKLQDPKTVPTTGITKITKEHSAVAERFGCALKLIGHTEEIDGKLLSFVQPCLVPSSNPISHVDGVFNGILVDADMLGRSFFYGAGAGKLPTASAVVADVIQIAKSLQKPPKCPIWKAAEARDLAPIDSYVCRRVYVVEGCHKCAEKALAAFGSNRVEFFDGGFFALLTPAISGEEADKAFAKTGLSAKFVLPVLD